METKKNILVIGASSGYGQAIARLLNSNGFSVIGASREINDSTLSHNIKIDVRSNESVKYAFEEVSKITDNLFAVIYSSGVAKGMNKISAGNPEWWDDVFQTNTLGLLRAIKFSNSFLKSGSSFIHIGSISSKLNYIGGADYCASKAASSSIMKNLRLELANTGIRTMSIEPGYAKTNFMLRRFDGDETKANKGIKPLDTEDLAKFVHFILEQNVNVNFDEVFIKPLEQVTH